jgi:hypothetical protein
MLGIHLGDLPALTVVEAASAVVDAGDDLIAGSEGSAPTSISSLPNLSSDRTSLRAVAFRRSTSTFRFATISASSPWE